MHKTTTTPTTPQFAKLPVPAGAASVDEWHDDHDGNGLFRYFTGTRWAIELPHRGEHADVMVGGFQYASGRIERRWISINANADLSIGQARQLARHLTAAADEMEQLAAGGKWRRNYVR